MISNIEYINYYADLIIIQYKNKPNAKATIDLISGKYYEIYNVAQDVINMLEIDTNYGAQLDIIGDIIGISRLVPDAIPPELFGFFDLATGSDYSDNALPFGDLTSFNSSGGIGDLSVNQYTSLQLSDIDYRRLLKAKISINTSSSSLVSDGVRPSLNDSISLAFNGLGFITDNSDMSLNLHTDYSVSLTWIKALFDIGVIVKPQGVQYKKIIRENIEFGAFGFGDLSTLRDYSDNAISFGDLISPVNNVAGYTMAELLSLA